MWVVDTQYKMTDGALFEADSPEELVTKMRADSSIPTRDIMDYMRQTAARVREYNGAVIRYWSPELFVSDLIAARMMWVRE